MVEPLLEIPGMPHDLLCMPVLRLEIGNDLGILTLPQPVVIIHPGLAVNDVDPR